MHLYVMKFSPAWTVTNLVRYRLCGEQWTLQYRNLVHCRLLMYRKLHMVALEISRQTKLSVTWTKSEFPSPYQPDFRS
jgi:hypothetical protein